MKKNLLSLICLTAVLIFVPGSFYVSLEEQVTAFVGVNLITMKNEQVLEDHTVLVTGSEISSIGPRAEVRIPDDALVIDGEGLYLLPGLADMHMHTREDWDDQDLWPVQPLYLYLANGVTTVRDMGAIGGDLSYIFGWREEIRSGLRQGPEIIASGKIIYGSPLPNAEGWVVENHSRGFDFLKIYSYPNKEDAVTALQKARQLEFYSTGHIPFSLGLESALEVGLNEVAHVEELIYELFDLNRDQDLTPGGWMDHVRGRIIENYLAEPDHFATRVIRQNGPKINDIGDLLARSHTPVCTTLVVDEIVISKLFDSGKFLGRPENRYFEHGYLESFLAGNEKHLVQCRGYQQICLAKARIDTAIFRALSERGVLLLLGTDAGTGGMGIVPGYSLHDELELMAANGMSPYQALRTGTINAGSVAKRMNVDGNFGSVEVGNRADLILVANNPLEDLSVLRDPAGVMARGRWYDRELLRELISIR